MLVRVFSFIFLLLGTSFVEGSGNDLPASTSTESTIKSYVPGRIVNGTRAYSGQFPQQVSLRRTYSILSHFCGGTILTPEWVLTAGHCMYTLSGTRILPWSITVIAGEVKLKTTKNSEQWSGVSEIIMHPGFNRSTLENDITLLKMTSPFIFNSLVRSAPISTRPTPAGVFCEISGWGYQDSAMPIVSRYLMHVDLPVMTMSVCRELLADFTEILPGMFCAGYLEGEKDACQGDSGGGMLCKGKLSGIVSGGYDCAKPYIPGIYTDVLYYIDWLGQYVNLMENVESPDIYPRFSQNVSTIRHRALDDISKANAAFNYTPTVLMAIIMPTIAVLLSHDF